MIETKQLGSLEYLVCQDIPVPHCFTTRLGGISSGYLSSLNIGTSRGDDPNNVIENYRRLGDALGFDIHNLVLSRQGDLVPKGAEVFHEVQPMLDAAGEDAFVIGGAQVYRLLLPACRRLYVTQIDADGGADVFFPEPAPALWRITEQSPWQEEQGLRYRYLTYERKDGTDGI